MQAEQNFEFLNEAFRDKSSAVAARLARASSWAMIALFFVTSLAAQPPTRRLKWDQLAPAAVGQRVVVELKDGSRVEGIPVSVSMTALIFNVQSNSHKIYKKGQVAIPREDISLLRVRGGKSYALLGLLVGGSAAATASALILRTDCKPSFLGQHCLQTSATIGAAVGVTAAASVGGFLIGRKMGHAETQIISILPD